MALDNPPASPTTSQHSDKSRKRHSWNATLGTIMGGRRTSHRHSASQPLTASPLAAHPRETHPRRVSFAKPDIERRDHIEKGSRHSHVADDAWTKQMVLSLDGGGIRGLCQLYILAELMRKVEAIEELHGYEFSASSPFLQQHGSLYTRVSDVRTLNDQGMYLPCHYFDYVGGTSTGGIIAILFGRLRMDVAAAIASYKRIWLQMAAGMSLLDRLSPVRKGRKVNTQSVQDAVTDIVANRDRHLSKTARERGSSKFIADDAMGRTLILTVEVNKETGTRSPYLFRSYDYNEENSSSLNRLPQRELDEVDISLVASATCAAPTYFSGVRMKDLKSKFRDGTLWSVNPTMELYREIHSLHKGDEPNPIELILSIGSGQLQGSGLMNGIRRRRNSFTIDQHPEQLEVDELLDQRAKREQFQYFRLDGPPEIAELNLDEWKDDRKGRKTFDHVEGYVSSYCKRPEIQLRLEQCAKRLVEVRHKRAQSGRWERFALGIYYTCDLCGRAKRRTFRPKNTSGLYRTRSNEAEPQPSGAGTESLGLSTIPLFQTRSNQSDPANLELLGSPRRPSAASGSVASDQYDEEDLIQEMLHRTRDFDYRDDFIEHLQREHEAPPPDIFWKPTIDKYVAERAHTKIR